MINLILWWMVKYTISLWIPTHDISRKEALVFAKKSHLERKLYVSKDFKTNQNLRNENEFFNFLVQRKLRKNLTHYVGK